MVSANMVPLVGVLLFEWDVFSVLFLYWIENGIVGALNVPKILLTTRNPKEAGRHAQAFYAAFAFPIHYGFFWFIHGVFVFALVGPPAGGPPTNLVLGVQTALADKGLLLATVALFLSHLADFGINYVGRREYLRTTAIKQQAEPYPRMVALHVTIVLGGFAIFFLGQPTALIALLVLTKSSLDLGSYLLSRASKQAKEYVQEPAIA